MIGIGADEHLIYIVTYFTCLFFLSLWPQLSSLGSPHTHQLTSVKMLMETAFLLVPTLLLQLLVTMTALLSYMYTHSLVLY